MFTMSLAHIVYEAYYVLSKFYLSIRRKYNKTILDILTSN